MTFRRGLWGLTAVVDGNVSGRVLHKAAGRRRRRARERADRGCRGHGRAGGRVGRRRPPAVDLLRRPRAGARLPARETLAEHYAVPLNVITNAIALLTGNFL